MSTNDAWNRSGMIPRRGKAKRRPRRTLFSANGVTPSRRGAATPLANALLLTALLAGAGTLMAVGESERAGKPDAVAARDAGGLRPGDEPCAYSGFSGTDAPADGHFLDDRYLHWAIAHHRLAVTRTSPK
jgi:hypothetical protein